LAKHLRQTGVRVLREIETLLLSSLIVEDDDVRVVPLNPFDVEILPLLIAFFLFQPATHLIEVV